MRQLYLIFFLLTSLLSHGQYVISTLSMQGDIYEWHDGQLGKKNTVLVTGTYREVKRRIPNSHPFYISDKWITGSLHYQGQTFTNVSMLYDMESEEVLFRHPEFYLYNLQPIKPIQQEVDWFIIDNHLFRYIRNQILMYSEGFYEVRYEGEHTSLLTKRIRSVVTDPEYMYANNDANILRLKDQYFKIKSRFLFYRQMKDFKKQIRLYIKQHRVRFKKDKDDGLDGLVQYCDTLIQNK